MPDSPVGTSTCRVKILPILSKTREKGGLPPEAIHLPAALGRGGGLVYTAEDKTYDEGRMDFWDC